MEDKRITAEEIMGEINVDMQQMTQKVADAPNSAEDGAIINQSEEPVRDAHAVFRQATYQKALSLLENKQRAFSSPSSMAFKMRVTPLMDGLQCTQTLDGSIVSDNR